MAKKEDNVPRNVSRLANEKHPSTLSAVKLFDIKQARAAYVHALKLSPTDQEAVEGTELAQFLTNLGANLFAAADIRGPTSNVASLLTIADKRSLAPARSIHHIRTYSHYVPRVSVPSHLVAHSHKVPPQHEKKLANPLQLQLLAAKKENAKRMKEESRMRSRMLALSRLHTGPQFTASLEKEKYFIMEAIETRKQLEHRVSDLKACLNIVVVGAGMAGLSAANQLVSFGFRNVVVLEALDRIGGRIHSVPYINTFGKFLEMGVASVDHATDTNSVYTLVKDFGLNNRKPTKTRKTSLCMYAKDSIIKSEVLSAFSLPAEIIQRDMNLINSHIQSELHQNIQLSLDDYLKERHRRITQDRMNLSRSQQLQISEFVNQLAFATKYQFGHTHHKLAIHLLGSNERNENKVTLPGGMVSILDPLVSNFATDAIILNSCVKRIEWNRPESASQRRVKITCSNGKVLTAHHVIVAVPLGHLKENVNTMFLPGLPVEKTSAINRVCFGSVGKIHLCYEKPFWPKPVNLIWLGTKTSKETLWRHTLQFQSLELHTNVLEVCILGHVAETVPDHEIKRQLTSILSKYFGCTSPSPVQILNTQWYSNPMFRGTHPYLSMDCSKRDQGLLAEPLYNEQVPEVLFAGDYTHDDYSCLLHAARLSGLREANRIHNFYNSLHCFENLNP